VLAFASGIFALVGGAWDWMVNGVQWIGENLVGAIARTLRLLEWLALHAIPEGLSWALGEAVGFARRAARAVEHAAAAALGAALHFLLGTLNTLKAWALRAVHLVLGIANRAWSWIAHAGARIWNLLSRPERLVGWMLAALVLPLVRFLIESGGVVLRWLLGAFAREAGAFAHMLEDVLSKLI
jgi:hypothetical protein